MGDSYHGACFEFLLNQVLDRLLSHDINVWGSLVKNNDLVLAQDSSANADKLALAHTEVAAILRD